MAARRRRTAKVDAGRKSTNGKSKKIRQEIEEQIGNVEFGKLLEEAMYEYGTYIVENRAIPDIHDGLKPVQRRVLWAAYKVGAVYNSHTRKTAAIVGETMGKYHPHGDAAINGAVNNMIEGAYFPLMHGQGNFGSYTDSAPAAADRYTECKLDKVAQELLLDPYYLKVTPMVPNYDGRELEPAYLPAKLPLVLATGASGIALGVTTKVPAFTVKSIRDVVIAMLNGETDAKKLAKKLQMAIKYGGQPTEGVKGVHRVFTTKGPVKLEWTCDYNIVGEKVLIVTGLHPEWNYDTKWLRIGEHPDVAEAANLSSGESIRLEAKIKKGADPDRVFDWLMKQCVDIITYRCNVTERRVEVEHAIPTVKTQFMATTPFAIVQRWIKWRLRFEQLALRQEMNELRATVLREKLLLLACRSLDVIFSLLKQRNIDKVKELSKKLDITEEDAKTIWSIAVGRLDRLSEQEQLRKLKELQVRAKQIKKDFASPKRPVLAQLQSLSLQ